MADDGRTRVYTAAYEYAYPWAYAGIVANAHGVAARLVAEMFANMYAVVVLSNPHKHPLAYAWAYAFSCVNGVDKARGNPLRRNTQTPTSALAADRARTAAGTPPSTLMPPRSHTRWTPVPLPSEARANDGRRPTRIGRRAYADALDTDAARATAYPHAYAWGYP